MNIFSTVPWDIKQYAIASFLISSERTAWNQALKKDERVFKKFDKNYAIRHHVLVLSRKFNSMKKRLHLAEEDLDESGFIVDSVRKGSSWFSLFFGLRLILCLSRAELRSIVCID